MKIVERRKDKQLLWGLIVELDVLELDRVRDGTSRPVEIERVHEQANATFCRYLAGAIMAEVSDERLFWTTLKDLLVDTTRKRAFLILDV